MLRDLNVRRSAALLGGVSYMLSDMVTGRVIAGHTPFVYGVLWVPWMVLLYRRLLVTRKWVYLPLTVLAMACTLMAGHTQWQIIGLVAPASFGLYMVLQSVLARNWENLRYIIISGIMVIVFFFGLLAVQFLPNVEYLGFWVRPNDQPDADVTTAELPVTHLPDIIFPFTVSEIDDQAIRIHEIAAYVGLIVPVLAIASFFSPSEEHRRIAYYPAVLALVGLAFALGDQTPAYKLVDAVLPQFQVPGRFLYMLCFSLAVLGGLGLEACLQNLEFKRRSAPVALLAGFVVIVALYPLSWLIAGLSASTTASQLLSAGGLLMQVTTLPSFQLTAAILAMWGVVVVVQFVIPARAWGWLALAAMMLDLGGSARYMAHWGLDNQIFLAQYYDRPNRYTQIDADPAQVRFPAVDPNGRLAAGFGIPVLAPFRRTGLRYPLEVQQLPRGIELSGSGYSVDRRPPTDPHRQIVRQIDTSYLTVLEGTLPRIYAVSAVKVAADSDTALQYLSDETFDPLKQAVVEGAGDRFEALPGSASEPVRYEAHFLTFEPNLLKAHVSVDRPALVVVLEVYYPGWTATVDGSPARIWQANHAFRGVVVGPGEHVIEMTFDQEPFWQGLWISLGTLAAMILVLAVLGTGRLRWIGFAGPTA
jgi:hypothetical protein